MPQQTTLYYIILLLPLLIIIGYTLLPYMIKKGGTHLLYGLIISAISFGLNLALNFGPGDYENLLQSIAIGIPALGAIFSTLLCIYPRS